MNKKESRINTDKSLNLKPETKKHPYLPITTKDRTLARLALTTVKDTSIPCPDDAELALLVDGRLSDVRQEELWNHLAACSTCYEQWRIIAEIKCETVKKRSLVKIISISGGLLAAAASVLLFVNIQHSSMPEITSMERPRLLCLDSVDTMDMDMDMDKVPGTDTAALVEEPFPLESMAVAEAESPSGHSALSRILKSSAKQYDASAERLEKSSSKDHFSVLDQHETTGEILLDMNNVIPSVLQKVKKAVIGDVIEVKTYKRDRGFRLEKREGDELFIQEYGFNRQDFVVTTRKLKKTLKTIIKTEFPRSNKVWMRTDFSGVGE